MFQYSCEQGRSPLCDLLICFKILFARVYGHWSCVFVCRDRFVGVNYCFALPCLSNDFFFMIFNLLLVLILLYKTVIFFFSINTKEFFS